MTQPLELSLVPGVHGGIAVYEVTAAGISDPVNNIHVFSGDLDAATAYLRQRMSEIVVEDEKGGIPAKTRLGTPATMLLDKIPAVAKAG